MTATLPAPTAAELDRRTSGQAWRAEVRRLAARAGRRHPGAQLPGARDPGRRRPRRRLPRAVPDRRGQRRRRRSSSPASTSWPRRRRSSAPDKTVLIPDANAGCSLADTITADQLRAWKAEHPGAVVVSYVNTTAEVKAETDICCTSSNAVEVVESIPADREVLFLPRPVPRRPRPARHRPRRTCTSGWASATCTPASPPPTCGQRVEDDPDAELLIHPECGCATSALWMVVRRRSCPPSGSTILSTGGMLDAGPADDGASACSSPPRPACCTSCARPTRSPTSSRSTPRGLPVHEDDHAGEAAALAARGPRRGRPSTRRSPPAPGPRSRRMVAIGTPSPVGE